ncbi:MAG: LysR substrate-binding domain-containing protein, partial [Pseudomonadota bacterium]
DGSDFLPTHAANQIAKAVAKSRILIIDALDDLPPKPSIENIKISVAPTFGSRWLAKRLPQLRHLIKPIQIDIVSRVDLSDDADLWIRHGDIGRWPGRISKPLLKEIKMPVASPNLVGYSKRSDKDVLGYPLLGVEARPMEWRDWAKRSKLKVLEDPNFTFEVTTSAWDAAIAGSGVALGDLEFLEEEITSGALVTLGTTKLTSHSYFLCRRRHDQRKEIFQVWDWFVSQT